MLLLSLLTLTAFHTGALCILWPSLTADKKRGALTISTLLLLGTYAVS